jgi:hypothetical protein
MNYLLTILNTPVDDEDFVLQFNRFMSPITTTNGRYIQYHNGTMLYHFDTNLDPVGIKDHLIELIKKFGTYCILSQINSSTTFCISENQVNGLLSLSPDSTIEDFPSVIHLESHVSDLSEFYDDKDNNDLVQKLMKKYQFSEKEPSVDEILDKIHNQGIDSLSLQELIILKTV